MVVPLSALRDQIGIKLQRIISIQSPGHQKAIDDTIETELVGIANYAIFALIQNRLSKEASLDVTLEQIEGCYQACLEEIFELVEKKNHDYKDAWRAMANSSIIPYHGHEN